MRWWGWAGLLLLFGCRQADPGTVSGGDGGNPSIETDAGRPGTDGGDGGSPHDGGPDGGTDGGMSLPRYPGNRLGYVNPIPAENQHTGDPNWRSGFSNPYAKQIEGYADRVSAKAGDAVRLMVRSDAARSASWTLYRIGWYGGAGARSIVSGTATVGSQPACPEHRTTGPVRRPW